MAGGFDLALRITRSLDDTSFISRKLAEISNALIASPDFLKQYGDPSVPADLTGVQTLYYANLSAAKLWQFQNVDDPVSVRVSGRLMTNSGIMQKEFALAGLGVAILPRFFCHQELADGQLVELLPDYPVISSNLYALWPERRHNPVRVRRLVDALQQALRREDLAHFL